MGTFTVRLTTPLTPAEAWRRIWDLDAHTRVIPLTRLRGDGTAGAALGVGGRFVARTGLGPLAVDDVMEVRHFDVPDEGNHHGRAIVEKSGRVVRGRIDARVEPAASGSRVTWTQEIGLAPLPRAADPILERVAAAAYRHVLRRLLKGG